MPAHAQLTINQNQEKLSDAKALMLDRAELKEDSHAFILRSNSNRDHHIGISIGLLFGRMLESHEGYLGGIKFKGKEDIRKSHEIAINSIHTRKTSPFTQGAS